MRVEERLCDIAGRINTGATEVETSRALVVFNLTDRDISGVAVFHADMAWPKHVPLPPVSIAELETEAVLSSLAEMWEGPDRKSRPDHRRLTFALRFAVRNVPPQGWRTYIATYASEGYPNTELPDPTPGLVVVETLRHAGDLPPVGTWRGPGTF